MSFPKNSKICNDNLLSIQGQKISKEGSPNSIEKSPIVKLDKEMQIPVSKIIKPEVK